MMTHSPKKTHFGLKGHFSVYLEGQTQCTLRFWGMMIPVVQVSKLYDDPFLRKTHFGLTYPFSLYLEDQS